MKKSKQIDGENQRQKHHGDYSDVPLNIWLNKTSRYKKYHQILHIDEANFVKVLDFIVDVAFVWHNKYHIPEVDTLCNVKGQN